MLTPLPFALLGIAALFPFLLHSASRALSLGVAICAAFAAQTAGIPLLWSASLGVTAYVCAEWSAGYASIRWRGQPAAALMTAIVLIPALVAGFSVGALGAAWFGLEPIVPGTVTALTAALIAGRRLLAQPV